MPDEKPAARIPAQRLPDKLEQALAEQAATWAKETPEELERANELQRRAFLAAHAPADPS